MKSAGIAIGIMAVFNLILLVIRFTIGPIFVYQFEFLVFELPLALLVVFFFYLWYKSGRESEIHPL